MPHKVIIDGLIGWEVGVKDVREQLDSANGEDVVVEIASEGGWISEGLKIFNELNNYKGNVDTHLTGEVASMASYIAMVGKHRTAENNAVFMIHNGSGFAFGDHRIMFKLGNHLDSLTNIIAKELSTKSGTSLDEIREAMDETTFYYGDEIKDAGFVHEMVGDAEPENRAEAVALAELNVKACQAKFTSDPDLIKKDMLALSTMMADEPEMSGITADNGHINNPKVQTTDKEEPTMTLAELKEKHLDLYNQVMALGLAEGLAKGVTQERDRVKKLVEMRGGFPKAHSQKVIDQAISEGHDLSELTVNLLSADQAAKELEDAKADDAIPPGGGVDDAPEMKDGVMTHQDHVDAMSDSIAKLPGVM